MRRFSGLARSPSSQRLNGAPFKSILVHDHNKDLLLSSDDTEAEERRENVEQRTPASTATKRGPLLFSSPSCSKPADELSPLSKDDDDDNDDDDDDELRSGGA